MCLCKCMMCASIICVYAFLSNFTCMAGNKTETKAPNEKKWRCYHWPASGLCSEVITDRPTGPSIMVKSSLTPSHRRARNASVVIQFARPVLFGSVVVSAWWCPSTFDGGTQVSWRHLGYPRPFECTPRNRWCRGVVQSRMRVAFRLRRWCRAMAGLGWPMPFNYAGGAPRCHMFPAVMFYLLLSVVVMLGSWRVLLVGQPSPRLLRVTPLVSPLCVCC